MPSWWVRRGEQVFGPMDEATLADSIRQGRIDPGDLACREGGKEWLLVTAIPAVARVFAPKPSQPPVEQDQWREAVWMLGDLDGEILEGPLSLDDVRQGMQVGRLTGGELVARVGSSVWQQIGDVMEAKRRLSGQPPSASASVPMQRASIPPVATPIVYPAIVTEPVPKAPPMMHATQTAPVAPAVHAPPVRPAQVPPSRPPNMPPNTAPNAPPRSAPPRPPPRTMATTQTAPRPPQPPPQPPPPSDVGWYVSQEGKSAGPFTLEQMLQGVAQGQLAAETMICRTDDHHWRPLATHPELTNRRGGPPPLPSRR